MQSCHTHIEGANHLASEHLSSEGSLLGHGHIGRTCAGHQHIPLREGLRHTTHDAHLRDGFIAEIHPRLLKEPGLLRRQTRDEHVLLTVILQRVHDGRYLIRCLPCAIDHLCGSLEQMTVEVHRSEPQVFEGLSAQGALGLIYGDAASRHPLQERANIFNHGAPP